MNRFAGNLLALRSRDGAALIAGSDAAWSALGSGTGAAAWASRRDCLRLAIPTIERLGGGSVRCMIAEVFLPRGVAGAG